MGVKIESIESRGEEKRGGGKKDSIFFYVF